MNNLKEKYKIKSEYLFTKPKISIFDGRKLTGKVESTYVRGKLIYDRGEIIGKQGSGKMLTPNIEDS